MERQKEKQCMVALVFWDHVLPKSFLWERQDSCSAYRLQGLIIWVIKHSSGILREWAWKLIFSQENNPLYLKNTVCTTSNSELQTYFFCHQYDKAVPLYWRSSLLIFCLRLTWATTSRLLFFFSPSVLGIHRKKTNCYEVTLPQERGFKEISRFWH